MFSNSQCSGHQELVEWLVAHGAVVDATTISGKQAIHSASNSGNLRLVKWLVQKGVSPSATSLDGWQPIHVAAYSGRREVVDWLISQGVALDGHAHCGALVVKPLVHILSQSHIHSVLISSLCTSNASTLYASELRPLHTSSLERIHYTLVRPSFLCASQCAEIALTPSEEPSNRNHRFCL